MIEITPEIMGPGIEEEYADALAAIADLRRALGERRLTNSTPDGRILLEVAWVEQEIGRGQLPMPVDRSYAGTIYYLTGSGELVNLPGVLDPEGVEDALDRLYPVLQGYGLIKPRHIPVLIAMIDDLSRDAHKVWEQLSSQEREVMNDMAAQAEVLRNGAWPSRRRPQDRFFRYPTPNLDRLIDDFGNRVRGVSFSLFDGWRPFPARKPPLAAPVAGLPDRAPPLPPELADKLP